MPFAVSLSFRYPKENNDQKSYLGHVDKRDSLTEYQINFVSQSELSTNRLERIFMRLSFSYITAFAVILLAFAFLYFPIEFIDTGIGQGIFFFLTNLAATLASLYWENGIRYDCSNVHFLGYQSSFSQVIPIVIDGASQNLSMRIDGVPSLTLTHLIELRAYIRLISIKLQQ